MRRPLVLLAFLAAPVALLAAGCGDPETTSGSGDTSGTESPSDSTAVLTKPSVALPDELPAELVITDLEDGSGPEAASGDLVIVHYVGVRSATGEEFDNSYDGGSPFPVTLGAGEVITGWDQGLVGVQQGTRRQLDIPSDLAYGDSPNGDVIQAGDALSFVIDVVAVIPASSADDAPDVVVEPSGNVEAVTSKDLIVGEGAEVQDGRTAAIHLVVYRADTGEQLDSTWGTSPLTFTFGPQGDLYSGILDAVAGMHVGGRRQAQIPFTAVFDGKGNETLGLPAGIDIVMVIDLVTQY